MSNSINNDTSTSVKYWRERHKYFSELYKNTGDREAVLNAMAAKEHLDTLIKQRQELKKKRLTENQDRTNFKKATRRESLLLQDISDLSGVNYATVNALANGRKTFMNCEMGTVLRILEAMGDDVKLIDILEDTDVEKWAKHL